MGFPGEGRSGEPDKALGRNKAEPLKTKGHS